jgi:hypothetical protein
VERIAPLAVDPRDFVEEWLQAPWNEAAAWSERELRKWHQPPGVCTGIFHYPVAHCAGQPDVWQIAWERKDKTGTDFLVRWRPPYRFSMVDVRGTPWPACKEEDRLEAPYPAGTLFPFQKWRR